MSRATVSDHAVLRLLAIKYGVDVEVFRAEIADAVDVAFVAGARGLKADGLHYEIRGGAVVDVYAVKRPLSTGGAIPVRKILGEGDHAE